MTATIPSTMRKRPHVSLRVAGQRARVATTTAIDRESGRMDSALTYALFTPIGIAREDDLDASE